MADNQKRIAFSGVDAGLGSMMDRFKQKASDLSEGLMRDAQRYSQRGEEQVKFIEQQIRAIERRNKLERDQRIFEREQQRDAELGTAKTELERKDIEADFREDRSAIMQESREDSLQTEILKNILEEIQETARQEIANDRENVERQVSELENLIRRDEVDRLDAEEAAKRAIQRDILREDEGDDRGVMGQVFGGTLLANAVSDLLGRIGGAAGVEEGEQAIYTQIPFVGQFFERARGEEARVQEAEMRLRGFTGRTARGAGINLGMGSQFGFGKEETLEFSRQLAEQLGTRDADTLGRNVRGGLASERAFDLDRGTIIQMFRDMRSTTDQMSIIENVAAVVNMVPELKENRQLTGEFLNIQSNLVENLRNVTETIDRQRIAGIMGRFAGIDSPFFQDPQRMEPILQSIQQTLTRPQGEFAQARSLQVLSQLNRGSSLFELLESRQRGIAEPGFMQAMMENLSRQFGTGEELMLGLTGQQFGGGGIFDFAPEVSRAIVEAFREDPTIFRGAGSEEEIMRRAGVTPEDIEQEARDILPIRTERMRELGDAFADGALPGMLELGKQVAIEIVEGFAENGEKIGSGIGREVARWILFAIPDVFQTQEQIDFENGTTSEEE